MEEMKGEMLMTKKELVYWRDFVYNMYKNEFKLNCTYSNAKTACINRKERVIFFNKRDWDNPTYDTIFDLLHEIGHYKTNTDDMRRCVKEFFATQWAIDEAKRIGFPVDKHTIELFQEYIWEWLDRLVKAAGEQIIPKDRALYMKSQITLKI